MARRKLPIGAVIEFRTAKGFAYAQYIYEHRVYGSVIRVLPGFHSDRPADFAALVASKEAFRIFVPLRAMVARALASVVAVALVPEPARALGLWRCGVAHRDTQRVEGWWLWDGEHEWYVGELNKAQQKLPIREIWNDTMLISRIERVWTPDEQL